MAGFQWFGVGKIGGLHRSHLWLWNGPFGTDRRRRAGRFAAIFRLCFGRLFDRHAQIN
jgi:hypothetical protein